MFYLIQPSNKMQWTDFPMKLEDLTGLDVDLAKLEWRDDTDYIADPILVAMALRHGAPATTGLVVQGIVVAQFYRPLELRKLIDDAHERFTGNNELMEQLVPGWTEAGRDLDERVAESMNATLKEAMGESDRLLDGEPDARLVSHWRSLGGSVPELI